MSSIHVSVFKVSFNKFNFYLNWFVQAIFSEHLNIFYEYNAPNV